MRHDPDIPEPTIDLASEFRALTPEVQLLYVEEARKKAKAGKCFMCKHIVERTHFEDFPKESRAAHLLLCHPDPTKRKINAGSESGN